MWSGQHKLLRVHNAEQKSQFIHPKRVFALSVLCHSCIEGPPHKGVMINIPESACQGSSAMR